MKPVRRILPALVASLIAGAAAPASAAQFTGVVVFGDSLSDVGYYRPFLSGLGLPASLVSTLGRFTTNPGPVWSELVSSYYGFTAAPSNAGGNIFAQGGATVATSSPSTPPGFAQRPVSTQITEYLARNGGAADSGALYAVWAGGNDFLNNFTLLSQGQITQAQFQTNFLGAASAEVQQVGRLYAAGARYVLVFTLPDIGATPFALSTGATNAATATAASAGYNLTLFTSLKGAGMRPIPVDTFSLITEIRANAAAYGFTNTTGTACGPFPPITTSASAQFCYSGNLVAANADQQYLFADGVHPSSGAHRVIGDFVKSLVDGPTAYSLLGEVPLKTRAAHVQTLNDGLMQGEMGPVGAIKAFAGVAGAGFDVDAVTGGSGLRSDSRAYSVGLAMRATEGVTVGAAFGASRADATLGQGLGGFKVDEQAISAFASAKSGGLWANGMATMSNIDFDSIRRTIKLGAVTRTAEATTKGSNVSFAFMGGYDFKFGGLAVGPTVGWTSQNVDVNGFDETGGGSAGLRMASQNRRSEVASVGARASWDLGAIVPYAKFTADKERRNEERLVTATPLTMATIGSAYDLPAYSFDSSFTTFTVGVRGTFGSGTVGYGINYAKVSGRSGIKEDLASATLSVRF